MTRVILHRIGARRWFFVKVGFLVFALLMAVRIYLPAQEGAPDPTQAKEAAASDKSLTVWLTVRRGSSGPTATDRVSIAAGGKSGEAHYATVDVTFDPPLSGDTEVDVSLVTGGAGFEPSAWWWSWLSSGRIRAKLDVEGQTFTYGTTSTALSFSPSGGALTGTVTSSNMVETTAVQVEVPSKGISLNCPIDFVVGDYTVDLGDGIQHNAWTSFTIKRNIGAHPIASHDLTLVISKVYLSDGSSVSASLGSTEGSSTDLSSYVELDGPALVYSYQNVTTDNNGEATGQYKVVNDDVLRFEVTSCDMSVAEDAQ